jgi:predicted dehydrogenase
MFFQKYNFHSWDMRDYQDAIDHPNVDAVFVCVPNALHYEVTQYALQKGKHVLCEKPLAVDEREAHTLVQLAEKNGLFLKTGSNHRFLPNIQRAREIVNQGLIGDLVSMRGYIGHHNVLPSWFYNKSNSGGGVVLDLGVHLYDLTACFLGNIVGCVGAIQFTDPNCDVESYGFSIFESAKGQLAMLQASWTEWNDYLSLEISGREGYIGAFVSSNGGLKLVWIDSHGEPHQETEWEEVNDSWTLDTKEFLEALVQGRQPIASGHDGLIAVKMAWAVYRSSQGKKYVHL